MFILSLNFSPQLVNCFLSLPYAVYLVMQQLWSTMNLYVCLVWRNSSLKKPYCEFLWVWSLISLLHWHLFEVKVFVEHLSTMSCHYIFLCCHNFLHPLLKKKVKKLNFLKYWARMTVTNKLSSPASSWHLTSVFKHLWYTVRMYLDCLLWFHVKYFILP